MCTTTCCSTVSSEDHHHAANQAQACVDALPADISVTLGWLIVTHAIIDWVELLAFIGQWACHCTQVIA